MPPQMPIKAFKPKVQETFEQYFNTSYKAGKLFRNTTPCQVFYLQFLSNLNRKIVKPDKHEKFHLYIQKRLAINKFSVDNSGQLLQGNLKKGNVTQPQGFVYNTFDIIAQIYAAGRYIEYKKTS